MSEYPKLFPTREAAEAEKATMRGWERIRIARTTDYLGEQNGEYIIKTEGGVLCEDGYVREIR